MVGIERADIREHIVLDADHGLAADGRQGEGGLDLLEYALLAAASLVGGLEPDRGWGVFIERADGRASASGAHPGQSAGDHGLNRVPDRLRRCRPWGRTSLRGSGSELTRKEQVHSGINGCGSSRENQEGKTESTEGMDGRKGG